MRYEKHLQHVLDPDTEFRQVSRVQTQVFEFSDRHIKALAGECRGLHSQWNSRFPTYKNGRPAAIAKHFGVGVFSLELH